MQPTCLPLADLAACFVYCVCALNVSGCRYFTQQQLRDLFTVTPEGLERSSTQQELHRLHAHARVTSPDLQAHLEFLEGIDGYAGGLQGSRHARVCECACERTHMKQRCVWINDSGDVQAQTPCTPWCLWLCM